MKKFGFISPSVVNLPWDLIGVLTPEEGRVLASDIFNREFAKLGRNLALCARRVDRLEKLKDELKSSYPGITVHVRTLDVTNYDQVFEVFKAFKADSRYGKATEVVMLDPADNAEQHFLTDLQVDPRTTTAVTVLITPPGAPVARFAGAVTKDEITAKVKEAESGCGAGCERCGRCRRGPAGAASRR